MAAPVWDSSGAFAATDTSGATLNLVCPATVNAGDLLIAHTVIRITNRGMAPTVAEQGNGWVTWRGNTTSYSASGPVGRHFIHAKIADGTEGGDTISFDVLNAGTPDNASTTPRHGQIHRFTGNATGTIADETNGDVLAGFAHGTGNNTVIQDTGVTTDEADCLAVNLVYVSDDNAPFGSFTGETGGDWVHRAEGETQLGSDGAQMLQTATMASAGTINGGTYTMGAADPFGVFGFFIRAGGAAAYTLDCQPGSFAITGAAATLVAARLIDAQPGSYAVTGVAASLVKGYQIDAQPGSYAVTGASAGLLADRTMNAQPGSYTVTGVAAVLSRGYFLQAEPGVYVITGFDVSGDNWSVAYTLDAEPGSFVVTGAPAALLADRVLKADPGSFAVTGVAAALLADRVINAQPGVFVVTGIDAEFEVESGFTPTGKLPATGNIVLIQTTAPIISMAGAPAIVRLPVTADIAQLETDGTIVVVSPEGDVWRL